MGRGRKAIPASELLPKYAAHWNKAITGESPLACVLIATALVENATITLLHSLLREGETSDKLFKQGGILGDFFKCTNMAYSLCLISKPMEQNLEKIGEIRNIFAHSPEEVDFSNAEVEKMCSGLELPPSVEAASSKPYTARDRFCLVGGFCFARISFMAAATNRLTEPANIDWPARQ